MARWRRVASSLLVQLSIPIAMYSGALLWLSARLAWDPSTYVWLRLAARRELDAAVALLPAAAALLAALPHLAAAAVAPPSRRLAQRLLLMLYILICSGALGGAAALGVCAAGHAAEWRAAAARLAEDARDLAAHGRALLDVLAKHHPLPKQLNELIDEALADLPRLAWAGGGAAALLLLLLLAGTVLAAALALAATEQSKEPTSIDLESADSEQKPLQPRELTRGLSWPPRQPRG